jgi:RIO kinase 1
MELYDIEGTLASLQKKKINLQILQTLKAGKEAQVYLADWKNQPLALKIYKDHKYRTFNNVEKYTESWWIPSRTMAQSVKKKTRRGLQDVQDCWVEREFKLLKKAYENGCRVPEPVEHTDNAILMEYIGDDHGPAPLLKDVKLTPEQAKFCMDEIFECIKILFDIGYAHSDLSAFNILWWDETPYIIDFPQAVEVRSSPKAVEYILRDFRNVAEFLGKFGNVGYLEYYTELQQMCMWI